DKPMSELLLFTGSPNDLMELTEEEKKTAISWDPTLVDHWKTWKRYADQLPSKRFILTERPCFFDPSHTIYAILNIKRTKELLSKHRLSFQKRTGLFFNTDAVIHEFKNPNSLFWEKVFKDHYLSGLLFGYGQENVAYFDCEKALPTFSEKYNPSATPTNFSLPVFAISPTDQTTERYRQQRVQIQHIYQNQDMIEVTLHRLIE
ncbi:MAG: hypothetical protein KGJ02_07590, partial [Verrucomicrobiota bacterium]|nr:hypothetical protein [Verrucomicrobiota bacterium]